jgi:hypothetical protein
MPDSREDPIVRSSRREAVIFLLLWLAALGYTVGYSYTHGYDRDLDGSLDGMTFVFGWPDWVFYGVVAPWLVFTAISIVFALFIMRDAELGEELEANKDAV